LPDDETLTPWRSEEDEYAVLADLLVPAAQQNFHQGLADWDALDTKALGVVGLDAAAIAVLVAAHEAINRFWWIPTIGLFVAGSLLIACVWPRRADLRANSSKGSSKRSSSGKSVRHIYATKGFGVTSPRKKA
jgi:hypothetical protein